MENNNILKFGLDIIEFLTNDSRFSFDEGDLRLFTDGLSSDDEEISKIIADSNKVYFNSEDEQLHGNYLMCCYKKDSKNAAQDNIRFNLDAYYADYLKSDIDSVCEKIADEIIIQQKNHDGNTFVLDNDYESLRKNLIIRMLNYPNNDVRLKGAIYDKFGDMAICSYIKINHKNGQFQSSKVTRDLLKKYNVTAKQVKEDALLNSAEILPARVYLNIKDTFSSGESYSLDEAIKLVKSGEKEIVKNEFTTLVLTNTMYLNGASAIFYPDVAEKLAELLGGDYFAVFTSIHDAMIHPAAFKKPKNLRSILSDLNRRCNGMDEKLTDNIYRYDSRKKQLKEV